MSQSQTLQMNWPKRRDRFGDRPARNPGHAAYAASKAALLAYVRSLAIESARRGVTVN
jgi:NAD(P)-dependent dehydrogenase (short-subunit alcohol dehydrogenase family)